MTLTCRFSSHKTPLSLFLCSMQINLTSILLSYFLVSEWFSTADEHSFVCFILIYLPCSRLLGLDALLFIHGQIFFLNTPLTHVCCYPGSCPFSITGISCPVVGSYFASASSLHIFSNQIQCESCLKLYLFYMWFILDYAKNTFTEKSILMSWSILRMLKIILVESTFVVY